MPRRTRTWLAAACWLAWLFSNAPATVRADEPAGVAIDATREPDGVPAPIRIPLVFHVARRDGKPVADDAFLASQLAHANAIYGSLGIELVAVEARRRGPRARAAQAEPGTVPSRELSEQHARLVERRDRDALGALLVPRRVNCFIVAALMDVDEPGRERRGVHWRVRANPHRHFVVVSAISGPYVLAHEIGHFLGNAHSHTPGNLMSYQHKDGAPVLDAAQAARVRQVLRALLASGEVVALTANASPKR